MEGDKKSSLFVSLKGPVLVQQGSKLENRVTVTHAGIMALGSK